MKKSLIKLFFIAIVPSILAQPIMLSTYHQQLPQAKKETLKLKRDVSDNRKQLFKEKNRECAIGTIDINNEFSILEAFAIYWAENEILEPINFEEHTIFVLNIRYNSADINILDESGEEVELSIRVNFVARNILLSSVIRDTDLGEIPNNSQIMIHNILQQRNPDLLNLIIGIEISAITTNSALVSYNDIFMREEAIRITFTTRNYMLNTFIERTNLNMLSDARPETIMNRLRELNPRIPENFNLGVIEDIETVVDVDRLYTIRLMSALLVGDQPERIPYVSIPNDEYYFIRPATAQEIVTLSSSLTYVRYYNEISLSFSVRVFNNNALLSAETNSTSSDQNDSNQYRSFSNSFCLDSDLEELNKKRNIGLNFSCWTLVNAFGIVNKYNTQGGNVKSGYVYLGTNDGAYLSDEKGRVIGKFEGIESEVIDIKLDGKGSAFAVIENGEVYHLDLFGWKAKKLEIKTKDLNKEIELYYQNDKNNVEISSDWWYQTPNDIIVKTFNLGPINPTYYTYIAFIGAAKEFSKTRVSWGNEAYYSSENLFDLTKNKKYKITKKIHNFKINDNELNTIDFKDKYNNSYLTVDKDKQTSGWTSIEYEQFIGLNFYWRDGNYYLQIVAHQQCNSNGTRTGGAMFLNLGNGIKLYN